MLKLKKKRQVIEKILEVEKVLVQGLVKGEEMVVVVAVEMAEMTKVEIMIRKIIKMINLNKYNKFQME